MVFAYAKTTPSPSGTELQVKQMLGAPFGVRKNNMSLVTLNDQLFHQMSKTQPYFEDSIVPLHKYREKNPPFIGSSIYIKFGMYYFLITAKHVIDELSTEYTIPCQDNPDNILQFYSDSQEEFDYCFAKLTSKLDTFKPLSIGCCAKYENSNNDYLFTAGFPETKVKYFNDNINCILECIITKEASDEEYKQIRANRKNNIVVQFEPTKIKKKDNFYTKLPFPKGMSGGGLFSVSNDIFVTDIKPKLVGLLTRWGSDNRKNMVATRIEIILAAIKRIYPEVIRA